MDPNYTNEWAVQRKRGNKLIIFRIPISQQINASYSLFRITYQEFRELLGCCLWELVDQDEYWSISSLSKNEELKKKFFDIAKNHINSKTRNEVRKKVNSRVLGTSCLIRSANKTYIQIGFRKGGDHTQINRVCIDNDDREKFFEDCRRTNDPMAKKSYRIRQGYTCFDYWSKFMDDEYKRQAGI